MKKRRPLKVGDKLPVWWKTGTVENDKNIARVMEILPYTGMFSQFFDCVLRLTSTSPRGYTEMADNKEDAARRRDQQVV